MPFIQVDNDNNIIQYITIGNKPPNNGYEITSIPEDILVNIFSYKYIDGEFIKKDNVDNEKFNALKQQKILVMSETCNKTIVDGVDWNGEHYSLTLEDQGNLTNLKDLAAVNEYIPYHPNGDGGNCIFFAADEFIQFYNYCFQFKLYHLTYFNQLKGYINSLTTIEDVLAVNYGITLTGEYLDNLIKYTNGINVEISEIIDAFDYNSILYDVNLNGFDSYIKGEETSYMSENEDISNENIIE